MTNPYEILGVKSDAGKSEIDAAYKIGRASCRERV